MIKMAIAIITFAFCVVALLMGLGESAFDPPSAMDQEMWDMLREIEQEMKENQ